MSFLFTFLSLFAHQQISNPVSYEKPKFPSDIEFLNDFPIIVHGGSFFTFDTTSLLKQKFIFVVSATRIAYFKQGGRLFIVNYLKRENRKNGYIDSFEGSGYKIKLALVKANRLSKNRVLYTGILQFTRNEIVTIVDVQGINEEYKLDSVR